MLKYVIAVMGVVGILLPYADLLINKKGIAPAEIIGIILLGIAGAYRKRVHKGEEIQKIYEKAPKESKEKLYKYAKEIEKEKE